MITKDDEKKFADFVDQLGGAFEKLGELIDVPKDEKTVTVSRAELRDIVSDVASDVALREAKDFTDVIGLAMHDAKIFSGVIDKLFGEEEEDK